MIGGNSIVEMFPADQKVRFDRLPEGCAYEDGSSPDTPGEGRVVDMELVRLPGVDGSPCVNIAVQLFGRRVIGQTEECQGVYDTVWFLSPSLAPLPPPAACIRISKGAYRPHS